MVLIFSCGRTGTNLMLEVLTGSKVLHPSNPPEDKQIFIRDITYPDNYLTKCDTVYCKNYDQFDKLIKNNLNVKIIWTIRDPRDMVLSKLYRGWGTADDGNPQGCLDDMFYMMYLYKRAISDYKDNIKLVKMEDIIDNISNVINKVTKFLSIPVDDEMFHPYKRMRHPGKRTRYSCLDVSQIGLWKRYNMIYNGFFNMIDFDIEDMFRMVDPITKYFGYRR